jgi:protein-tyrosine phosphatase
MIDLHCHMLPAIDDGAADLEVALEMARLAVADGIKVTACTPHIMPGVYGNTGPQIRAAIDAFSLELDKAGIELKLVTGADVHLATDLSAGLKNGQVLTLNDSRYFLFEPPHHVMPPRIEHAVFDIMTAGFHPVLTHPERLTWIEDHYDVMVRMAHAGVWMQITCGSVTGRFGRRPQYWADRMIDEGLVHILATDAHNLRNRSPSMAKSRDMVAERLGEAEAHNMVAVRPQGILDNLEPSSLPPPVRGVPPEPERKPGLFEGLGLRLFNSSARRSA